jgi:predicted phage terminase large subunit-like protein
MVEMPPRHGKSELCSKYFPVWFLGTFPGDNIILTSATDDLAWDFSEQARDIFAEYAPDLFGINLRHDAKSKQMWKTSAGSMLRAAGVGGSIMGRGAKILLIDDYFRNVKDALSEVIRKDLYQWYRSTSSTRLTPDGFIIVICTRWHIKDLTGQLLQDAKNGSGEKWLVIRMPAMCDDPKYDALGRKLDEALWPEQFSQDWMQRRRASYVSSGYEWMWQALYQQQPPVVLDAEFSPEYFRDEDNFRRFPDEQYIKYKILTLDPSLGKSEKSDYSAYILAALTWNGKIYVDADIQRRDTVKICKDGMDHVKSFKPDAVFVETVSFQQMLQTEFQRQLTKLGVNVPTFGLNNRENKIIRIRSTLTPHLANNTFKWRLGSPGVSLLLEQLKGFPASKFDDGPDALEMTVKAFEYLATHGLASESDNVGYDYPVPEENLGLPDYAPYIHRG